MRSLFVAPVLLSALVVGCAVEAAPPSADPPADTDRAALQASVDTFTRAVVGHDAAAFASVASSELLAHVQSKGGVDPFMVAMHGALKGTFDLADDQIPSIELADIVAEGDGVRVTLVHDGAPMPKSFYFVREGGALKLNLAPAGFSKAAPGGALFGKDNYTIHNVNIYGNPPVTLQCYQGSGNWKPFTVASQQTTKVACENTCGWFSGSTFAAATYDPIQRKCDWNWFGDDVRINLLSRGGWDCVSYC